MEFSLCYAKSLQSCLTLCDPIDGSLPGSPIPGILQARTLEWVAISFSNAWKWKVKVKLPTCVWLLVTPWTAAYQAPLSMGFSRQEYSSGVPLPSPIFSIPEIKTKYENKTNILTGKSQWEIITFVDKRGIFNFSLPIMNITNSNLKESLKYIPASSLFPILKLTLCALDCREETQCFGCIIQSTSLTEFL